MHFFEILRRQAELAHEDHEKHYISYFESDYPCSVCDRWCKSEKELKRHIQVHHGKRVKLSSSECKLCDENVGNKEELMNLNEKEPVESMDISRIVEIPKDGKFLCHFCDQTFQGKDDLMIHRKKDHQSKVSLCRIFPDGNCPLEELVCSCRKW